MSRSISRGDVGLFFLKLFLFRTARRIVASAERKHRGNLSLHFNLGCSHLLSTLVTASTYSIEPESLRSARLASAIALRADYPKSRVLRTSLRNGASIILEFAGMSGGNKVFIYRVAVLNYFP